MIAITGNTYPVKDQLKALGARWNPDRKVWMIAEDKADQARLIVAGAGPKAPYQGRRSSRGGCGCDCGDCSPCRCESHCNCRGGNVYDC